MAGKLRTALVPALAAIALATTALATPGGAQAVTFGLGDAPGTFAHCVDARVPCCANPASICLPGSVAGYYDNPAFRALTGPLSRHRITQVRFFVAFDAAQEWNGSTTSPGCRFSRALSQPWYDLARRLHPAGQSLNHLVASLIEAGTQGLTPIVSMAGYESPAAMPSWDQPAPDPTTIGGYWEYRCGLRGVLDAVSRLPPADQPHIWEAFNEPDAFSVYNGTGGVTATACQVSAAGGVGVDGAAKAACDFVRGAAQIHHFAGHAADTVVAGVFSHPSVPYLAAYSALLGQAPPGARFPESWSVHDYGDVTASFAATQLSALRSFDVALAADTRGAARELWVTEAGTELTDPLAFAGCVHPAALPNTLGACMNGQAARQAIAARAFFALPQAGVGVPITHLLWYQWKGEPNWDSGIVDPAGNPRAPWCAFFGNGACNGDPNAA